MSSGTRSFIFSATVVGIGLGGLWAWPALEDGGAQTLVARVVDTYRQADAILRATDAPPGTPSSDSLGSRSGTPQTSLTEIPSMRVAAAAPVVPEQCDTPGSELDAAVIGDRLQLRIFEASMLAGIPTPGDPAPSATDITFERLDLTGTYEVSATGLISLPAIGHVDIVGRSLPCIESLVSRTAFERLRTENSVSAAFAARPPILIRGAVRVPGSHNYSPGLTVERVLAQAGAVEAHDPSYSVRVATLETQRRELERTRAGLGLDRMRLEAVLVGTEDLSDDDRALRRTKALLGNERVTRERAALVAEIEAQHLRQARAAQHLKDLDARIAMAQRQTESVKAQLAFFDDRREQHAGLLGRGAITEARLEGTAIRVMETEQNLLQKQEVLLQLQAERRLAANDAALADSERLRVITAELRSLTAQSDILDSEYHMVLAELDVINGDGVRLAVTIERPTGSEDIQTITAVPTTLVRPGDLVTVSTNLGEKRKQAALDARDEPYLIQSAYAQ